MPLFYLPQLDGLRTFAFLFVFLYHSWIIPNVDPHFHVFGWYNTVVKWGGTGVDLFFVLSGYLITYLLLKEKLSFGDISFTLYFKRRMLRIWPLFYLVVLFAAFVVPLFSHRHLQWNEYSNFLAKIVVPMLFFVGNYALILYESTLHSISLAANFPLNNVFNPLWSICVEEQFYLTWPLLLKKLKTAPGMILSISILTVVSLLCRYFFQQASMHFDLTNASNLYYYNTLARLDPLMAGGTVAVTQLYFSQFWDNLSRYSGLMAIIGCLGIISIALFLPNGNNSPAVVPIYFAIALSYGLILVGSLGWEPLKAVLSNRVFTDIGKMTYCMYLIHHPIIVLCEHAIQRWTQIPPGPTYWTIKVLSSLAITYIVAKCSWLFIESKTNAWRKRYARSERELPTAGVSATA